MTRMISSGPEFSRRSFLAGVGGLTFSIAFLGNSAPALNAAGKPGAANLSAWVRIGADNIVTIFNPSAEMGQGSMTALPLIIAEEMDADWSRVKIEQSPVEAKTYGNPTRFGHQMLTVGSRTVQGYYDSLRKAGAQVRKVLIAAAADHWKVPASEVKTEIGVVVHGPSDRRLTYGEIAAFAKMPAKLPDVSDGDLKNPSQFRLIGNKDIGRSDIPAKVDGTAVYGLDVQVPGMVYAVMTRAPVHGSKPVGSNASDIKKIPGVIDVVTLNHGMVVVAGTMEDAIKARKSLKINWSKGAKAENFQSEKDLTDRYLKIHDNNAAGESLIKKGDVKSAMAGVAKTYQAEYYSDHAYHAQMEPLNAVAHVNAAGDGAEVWAGTQALDGARKSAAQALGVGVDKIVFHPCYLGGGFGRRSWSDYVEEAVLTSKAVKRPVKLMWSREDDIAYGAFRPMALQCLKAGVD
ncbi:MAG TPA: molybdopterin cofactor-binding domain-containing protein, partial [Rhodospirillales bacterium]